MQDISGAGLLSIKESQQISLRDFLLSCGAAVAMVTAMEIDWKQAPKRARWWAVDADGEANWFSGPSVSPFTDFWLNPPERAPLFGFDGNWRKSLVERPPDSRTGGRSDELDGAL